MIKLAHTQNLYKLKFCKNKKIKIKKSQNSDLSSSWINTLIVIALSQQTLKEKIYKSYMKSNKAQFSLATTGCAGTVMVHNKLPMYHTVLKGNISDRNDGN